MAQQNTQQLARHATTSFESPAQARVLHDALSLWRPQTVTDHRGSWMAPEARALKRLLYVADEGSGDVSVFSYPKGNAVGMLTGFDVPSGICTNKAGDVFVLNGGGTTIEVFAHGGTQVLRTLQLPSYRGSTVPSTRRTATSPWARSMVTRAPSRSSRTPWAMPVTYIPPNENGLPGCAYDNQGNLFCNAFSTGNQSFALFELPSGSATVQQIAVTTSALAGSMQWDGKYLAFTDGSQGTIEQLQVSGSTGSIVGSTTLDNTGAVWQFWVPGVANEAGSEATRVIAPTSASKRRLCRLLELSHRRQPEPRRSTIPPTPTASR